MSRWWRAYDEAVDDPKLCLLTDRQHRAWFNLMCVASMYGGRLPDVRVIAVKLRMAPAKVAGMVAELVALGLIDQNGTEFTPHNWAGRQFLSDVSTERVKRFRKRPRNVSSTVSETPPENRVQSTETEKKDTSLRSDADALAAPRDIRADLFGKGLQTLATITGKTPDSCRSLVGKWLKSVNDEAIHVIGAIENAERNRVADPVAWIGRALENHTGNRHGKRTVQDAARDLLGKFGDVPAADSRGESGNPVRLLPAR